jgi:pre-rRNA-processing protein TSR4
MVQLAFVIEETLELPFLISPVNLIPNKVGGLPIWLDPCSPMINVKCNICSHSIPLLCQLYCPEDYPENAFHRIIYIYSCRNGTCKAHKVFRSQLPLQNDIYTIEGDFKSNLKILNNTLVVGNKVKDHYHVSTDNALVDDKVGNALVDGKVDIGYCVLCGCLSTQVCGQCKSIRYCDKEHQQLDWVQGNHKQYCNSDTQKPDIFTKWLKSFRFPEYELEEEEEPEKPLEKITEEIEGLLKPDQGDADIIDEEETETDVDKAFLKFQKRISLAPDQILRYGRVNPEGFNEEPLFVSDQKDIVVPNCECGEERTFEFQVYLN